MITGTVGGSRPELGGQWDNLVRRGGNAFMDPAALQAAAETTGARIVTLCIWQDKRLVGFWALRISRPLPFLPLQLEALPYEYAFLSTPVLDPECADVVMPAFLKAIAGKKGLPRALWLKDFDAEGPAFAGLADYPQIEIKDLGRPVATRQSGVKNSGSTRKKLRQDWNRLCAIGEPRVVNVRAKPAALAGLEIFLELEAASWKGGKGTALLNDPQDAAFARRLIGDMAEKGNASVALLQVGGRPVAAQVLLYCGISAYTWKTSYDVEFAKFSPGALLVDRLTEALLAADIEIIDSCALDTGFMGQLWSGRKRTVDLVVSPTKSPGHDFWLAVLYRQSYEKLRRVGQRMRRARPRPAARSAPALPG
jgi:CelD/BcsL family acetyltransferase involved in cellulose biosynthesis